MFRFTSYIALTLCSRDGSTERWADLVAREMGNFTRTDGFGGWVGNERVETEPVVVLKTWLDKDAVETVERIVALAERFQVGAEQEAVFIEYAYDGKVGALVVFAGEWAEARAHLVNVFDPFAKVLEFFSPKAEAEVTPEGGIVVETGITF